MTVPRFSAGSSANAVPAIAHSTKTARVGVERRAGRGKKGSGGSDDDKEAGVARTERQCRAVASCDLVRSDFRRRSKAPVGGRDRRRAGSEGRRGGDGRRGRTGEAPKERGANHGDLSAMIREGRAVGARRNAFGAAGSREKTVDERCRRPRPRAPSNHRARSSCRRARGSWPLAKRKKKKKNRKKNQTLETTSSSRRRVANPF